MGELANGFAGHSCKKIVMEMRNVASEVGMEGNGSTLRIKRSSGLA